MSLEFGVPAVLSEPVELCLRTLGETLQVYHRSDRWGLQGLCPYKAYYLHCEGASVTGLTGRCYWEVEWSGCSIDIAVTYKGINRKGLGVDSGFGYNDKSWCLSCSTSSYSFWHNNEETAVSGPPSPRIGVYLDHRAGTLSFYRVSDTVTLLHRVQTTFTKPLYPGFGLWDSTLWRHSGAESATGLRQNVQCHMPLWG
uniref:B30.2/SPRY domain-containing protein n=1 Tax=Paramormyrops kingsleyae TaxID=1676925 RepID=A0A3B3S9W1_9TELE